jgi:site-specific DNA recombinase
LSTSITWERTASRPETGSSHPICLGRDGYRHLKGAVCDNKPIPQEQLDAVVWQEIMRLLEDPSLLQAELDRRLHAAQTTDPLKRREEALRRDQARLTKSMERLLTGYQENLITLEELRCRMPDLRNQQRANEAELQSLEMTAVDPTRNLRLVETLAQFRTRLRARGNVLEVEERQRVVRLLVHEILVSSDNITIRHSIPLPTSSPDPNHGVRPSHESPEPNTGPNYLLRSHGQRTWDNVSRFGSVNIRFPRSRPPASRAACFNFSFDRCPSSWPAFDRVLLVT